MSKKHGIIIAHVKTYNSIYFHGAMYRKYGFTKVNVRKAWFNHGTCKAHDYHGIVCKKTRYQDNIYKKYGIAMVNVQKHGIIMVHVKARYYQTGVHKKHSITRITYKKYCISLAPRTKKMLI